MSGIGSVYVWLFSRAFLFIALVSALLYGATRKPKVVASYCLAHVVALLAGAAFDLTIYKFVLHGVATVTFLEWIYAAPIFLFAGISLYLCRFEGALHLPEVLLPLAAVVAWALAIVKGPPVREGIDVIGAWFVAAGTGGVDLATLHGPPWARERKHLVRAAAYALVVAFVYVFLTRT
jgi:hypothetical protein